VILSILKWETFMENKWRGEIEFLQFRTMNKTHERTVKAFFLEFQTMNNTHEMNHMLDTKG
jgi:hypothetical protein